MTDSGLSSILTADARGNWVRLRTLTSLRWLAVAGQSVAVIVADQWLDIRLPLELCAITISASVCFNIAAHLVHPAEKRLSESGTVASLCFDLFQIAALLMLTGGLTNPFALLILVPVTISASALRLRSTIGLGALVIGLIPLMAFVHLPLEQVDGTEISPPSLLVYGFAAALAIGVLFFSLYARRVAVEGFKMSEALGATQLALAREQRLSAIGGIAAAVAHEMGTPLATIKLVAGELARELEDDHELYDDVQLIRSEADRCGRIMADLSEGARDDAHIRHALVSAVIEEASKPHRSRIGKLIMRINGVVHGTAEIEEPTIPRRPEVIHGLRNLIQNAADFARSTVWVDIDADATSLRIAIGDDGPGFPAELIPVLGEPFIRSRSRLIGERRARAMTGMGLGVFIACTLLQRTGARVSFANGSDARTRAAKPVGDPELARPPGAIVELVWPVAEMVASRNDVRGPLGENMRFSETPA